METRLIQVKENEVSIRSQPNVSARLECDMAAGTLDALVSSVLRAQNSAW